jgi:diaminopimelate decarboxylase
MSKIEKLRFITPALAKKIADEYGTPVYVYDEAALVENAQSTLNFKAPYGLTVRYAMKANPHSRILQILNSSGIHIDASSGFEAERAIKAGVDPAKILITGQETPLNLEDLVSQGVLFDACSLNQLDTYGKLFPSTDISIRVNPGIGSGLNNRLATGGPNASFGIWHEHLVEIKRIVSKYNLRVTRLLNHVGTGRDPDLWQQVARLGLDIIREFPDVKIFSMGGGFKVPHMQDDLDTNLDKISDSISEELKKFAKEDGRKLQLEIEPGRFLVANAGTILATAQDIVDTGEAGHTFLKLDAGMSEIIRPAMYGAQHPLVVLNNEKNLQKYVVVGHCCETSDTLTTELNDPEAFEPRLLRKTHAGDLIAIEVTGAYCSAFSTTNYNSFPKAAEVLLRTDKTTELISRRQTLDEMLSLEV